MKAFKTIGGVLGIAVALAVGPASAEDTLKLVIGQINNWENQAPTLGQDAGIFKKHGLVLENTRHARRGRDHSGGDLGLRRYRRRRRRSRRDARIFQRARRCASWRRCSPAPVTSTGT